MEFKKYFVSYAHVTNGEQGFGNHEVVFSKNIESIDDIRTIKKLLEQTTGLENIIIINYKTF